MKNIPLKSIRRNTPSVRAYTDAVRGGQHVTPAGQDWQVKKTGSGRATKIFPTQKEAIEYARNVALRQQGGLFIHGRNGQMQERNSYGEDSFPPRG